MLFTTVMISNFYNGKNTGPNKLINEKVALLKLNTLASRESQECLSVSRHFIWNTQSLLENEIPTFISSLHLYLAYLLDKMIQLSSPLHSGQWCSKVIIAYCKATLCKVLWLGFFACIVSDVCKLVKEWKCSLTQVKSPIN